MSWIGQSFVFLSIAVVCALGTRMIAGEYDQSIPCSTELLSEHEICVSTVFDDWNGDVIWIDARGRKPGKTMVSGALEISEDHWDEDSEKVAQQIFQAKVASKKVVVFCETDACGSSHYIRKKLISNRIHDDVYVIYSGWKAIQADGRLLSSEE